MIIIKCAKLSAVCLEILKNKHEMNMNSKQICVSAYSLTIPES